VRDAGGRGRIRTSVARKERQIYSLLVLTTHPPVPRDLPGQSCRIQREKQQCRKGSCPETPAPALLSRGIRPHPAKISRPVKFSWRRESNPRPSDYKSDALPAELRQHSQTERRYHSGKEIASKSKILAARPVPNPDPASDCKGQYTPKRHGIDKRKLEKAVSKGQLAPP
jgi:hypothetical protein